MMIASIQVVGSTLTSSELDEILQALSQNTLRFLCLQDCALEEREFKDLCRAIEEGTSLEHLSLSGAMLQDTDRVSVLTSALRRNASIINLSLNDNALKDAGVLSVVESLELHPQLSCLNLSECQIGDDGIKAISRLLPPCKARPGLRELDVSSNVDVTSRGWSHLAMAIASSSVLRSLSVAHANVGDAAASALCAAVAASATLQAVDLEKTGITNRSALVIMDLVQTFPLTLTSLRLNENAISEQLRMCIYACLKSATPPADEDCNEVSSSSSELVESMENTSISAAISRMDM